MHSIETKYGEMDYYIDQDTYPFYRRGNSWAKSTKKRIEKFPYKVWVLVIHGFARQDSLKGDKVLDFAS